MHRPNTRAEAADILIVGAGPAGCMAALHAAEAGASVRLFDSQEGLARKLRLTGGGRCNLNNGDADRLDPDHYYGKGAFLRPSFRQLPPLALNQFFEGRGLPLMEEAGQRFYPASGKAEDVRQFFRKALQAAAVSLQTKRPVTAFRPSPSGWLLESGKERHHAPCLLLSCGSFSYAPKAGPAPLLEGLRKLSLRLVPFQPGLVGLCIEKSWKDLAGQAIDDVLVRLPHRSFRGPLLWTHQGLTGPAIMNASRELKAGESFEIVLYPEGVPQGDGSPLSPKASLACLRAKQGALMLKQLRFPKLSKRFLLALLKQLQLPSDKRLADLDKAELQALEAALTALSFTVASTGSLRHAVVCRGGLALPQINPRSLMVKAHPGLYAAGEVLDIDGECGGFNLYASFATGALAAQGMLAQLRAPNT